MARGCRYTKPSLASAPLRVACVRPVCAMHSFYFFYGSPARLSILPINSSILLV